jgi:hypothetical protein
MEEQFVQNLDALKIKSTLEAMPVWNTIDTKVDLEGESIIFTRGNVKIVLSWIEVISIGAKSIYKMLIQLD